MKSFLKLFSLLFVAFFINLTSGHSQLQIVSDLTWGVGTNVNGPFNSPAFDVGLCVDENVIDCLCGPNYASPDLNNHFAGCANMTPIWGVPPTNDCIFPATTFVFNRTFNLTLDECEQIETAIARVQADNSFTFILNGQTIGSGTQWNQVNSYNVANNLVPGQNTITVSVNNANGGSCFNYAFFAFCLDITLSTVNLDASFNINPTPVSNGDFLSPTGVNDPNLNHEWYFLTGPSQQGPWTTNGSVLGSSTFNYFAEDCVHQRIIHRMSLDANSDCEECFEVLYHKCVGENAENTQSSSSVAPVDCSILNQWRFYTSENNDANKFNQNTGSFQGNSNIAIAPNPAKNKALVSWSQLAISSLTLKDMNGKQLNYTNISPDARQYELNLADLASGIYLVELQTVNGTREIKKIIVNH